MSAGIEQALLRTLTAAQRVETLSEQLAALAIAVRDQSRDIAADQAALRERVMRLETLIDASMLFSLRDTQARRNVRRSPGSGDPSGDDEIDPG